MTRSEMMTKYNEMKKEADDKARVNRALGTAQKKAAWHIIKNYKTTDDGCHCPDYIYRRKHTGQKCKHMMALEMMS